MKYSWEIIKNGFSFYYEELKELGECLFRDSDAMFICDTKVIDVMNERMYCFDFRTPEIKFKATINLFNVHTKLDSEAYWIGIEKNKIFSRGEGREQFVESLQKVIQEDKIKNLLSLHYARVAEIRQCKKTFPRL